jgi:Na+-transporting NADH:ubiquinone oxidoreductase subunit NqrF
VQIKLKGLASGKTQTLTATSEELGENLLKWLRGKEITIASSCDGEGVCKKCVIQNNWLTCKLTLKDFLDSEPSGEIRVAYL